MKNDYIIKIIDNYKKQKALYDGLSLLSVKQMELLKVNNNDLVDDLHHLLKDRENLLDEINALNGSNKTIQASLIEELQLEEFSLSKIKGIITPALFQELSDLIAVISDLLYQINENDKTNESLIRQNVRQRKPVSVSQASGAYQEAMQNLNPKKP